MGYDSERACAAQGFAVHQRDVALRARARTQREGNRAGATSEQRQLEAITATISPDRPLGTSNRAKNVAQVAVAVLAGELAAARSDHRDAAAKLTDAVRMQDALVYEEPPIWYFPVRESVGAQSCWRRGGRRTPRRSIAKI